MAFSVGRFFLAQIGFAERRVGLACCVVLVVCAHTTLLAPLAPAGMAASSTAFGARKVDLRLVPSASAVSALLAAEPVKAARRQRASRASNDDATAEPPQLLPAIGVEHAAATAQLAGGSGFSSPASDSDDSYLPHSALTVAPKAEIPIAIDYPQFDGEDSHYVGEFELFIDDTGGVVRVVNATPNLPGILSAAVRDAFLSARFVPGQVDGRMVRARMRIEVVFDSRPPGS